MHFNFLHLGQRTGEVQLIFSLISSLPFLLKNTAAIRPQLGIGKFFSHIPLQVCVCTPPVSGNVSAAATAQADCRASRVGAEAERKLFVLLVQRSLELVCPLPHLGLILGIIV